jgi:hypothetical protein
MSNSNALLLEIFRCPIISDPHNPTYGGKCLKIVDFQQCSKFQYPEPWSGQIETAPILFISSNPSIGETENYPNNSWAENEIVDFFQNRFTSTKAWVKDGKYTLLRDGNYSAEWVRFWASARRRAQELLRRNPIPGMDFAITEVVHCKSLEEKGVSEALEFCSSRYLERILRISKAKIFVIYGGVARKAILTLSIFSPLCDADLHNASIGPVSISSIPRMLCFLPHPNARGFKKSLFANLGNDGLLKLQEHLADSK